MPMTYEMLLGELPKLRQLVEVFRDSQWEALEEWLQAERQEHLERSVDVDDEEVARQHRVVARWLKHFLSTVKESLVDAAKAKPPSTDESDDSPYVERSSNIDSEARNRFQYTKIDREVKNNNVYHCPGLELSI